jgi:hypothetical protein
VAALLCLLSLACCRTVAAARAGQDDPGQQQIRRRLAEDSTTALTPPWLLPTSALLGYTGLDSNLDKLLQVQAQRGWVTLVPFVAGQEELALNCIASYLAYGKAANYIAYSFDPQSLLRCKQLQLPCYDAAGLIKGGPPTALIGSGRT